MSGPPTFDPGFSTPSMTEVLSPHRRVRAMLDVEAALARAGARIGAVPADVAGRIADACAMTVIDPHTLAVEGWEAGTPLIPLLDAIRSTLDDDAAAWLHHGSTTQDVVDTAQILRIRDALGIIQAALDGTASRLGELAGTHRSTPVLGRTLLQAGAVTSFGLVVTGWMVALDRHRHVIDADRHSLPVQFGGPVGNLDAFGDRAADMLEAIADELGLHAPVVPWHTDRSPMVAVAAELEALGGTIDKIAADVVLLAGFGEVRTRSGGSSAMPDKENPIDAVHARAAAAATRSAASAVGAGGHELQRAAGAWHVEWWAIPMTLHCAAAASEALERCISALDADIDAMAENIIRAGFDPGDDPPGGRLVDRALAERAEEDAS